MTPFAAISRKLGKLRCASRNLILFSALFERFPKLDIIESFCRVVRLRSLQ